MEKRLWVISFLTWGIGVFGLTWEYRKMTWLLFALFVAQARAFHDVPLQNAQRNHLTPEYQWQHESVIVAREDR
jgi:hypothetical protein